MSSTVGAIDRRQRAAPDDSAVRHLLAALCLALGWLLLGIAAVLVARRASGALIVPLSGSGLLIAASALESAITLFRYSSSSTKYSVLSAESFSRWRLVLPAVFLLLVPSLVGFLILASLTIPGTPAWGLILAWLLV